MRVLALSVAIGLVVVHSKLTTSPKGNDRMITWYAHRAVGPVLCHTLPTADLYWREFNEDCLYTAAISVHCATIRNLTTLIRWYDVAENITVDELNIKTIQAHTKVFSRVSPYTHTHALDGNVSKWWGNDAAVAKWNAPLQDMGVLVLPYLIDTSNSTQMHLIYANSTAVVADAVQIAQHYNFQGWFIDYEDETPPDTDPKKSQKLKLFLDELGKGLHAVNKTLTICVASWSKLLSDEKTLASSAADELQNMVSETSGM